MISHNHGPGFHSDDTVKVTRPISKVSLSRIRSLNSSIWGSARKPSTSLQDERSRLPTRTPNLGGRKGKEQIQPSPLPDQGNFKKATFQWVKGELLGKGSYAYVYLGLNATTGEIMAVKQVELQQTANDRLHSRHREITEALNFERKTLMDLDHANIVQYLGYEESPQYLSIFLEYVPGGTISSCLQSHGRFREEVTKSFTSQILAGLEYLHFKGILHRDLKSDNILVEPTGVCKISDFGISKKSPDARARTGIKGTIYWMAPEMLEPDKETGYDVKVDIWSVGCVVLEMWSGQRPWCGEQLLPVMMKLSQEKLAPPLPPDVSLSESASHFRQQCFRKDPVDRPTAAELQRHPYLVLPPNWRFEPSDIEGSALRHSTSQSSRRSRKSFVSIRQLVSSIGINSGSKPPIPPVSASFENSTLRPQSRASTATTNIRSHSRHAKTNHSSPEADKGPPIVFIQPPRSPPPDLSRISANNSRTSLDTSESVKATRRRGFRLVNPDPEPEFDRAAFVYTPPPLPGVNANAPYSARLSPPSLSSVAIHAPPEPPARPISNVVHTRDIHSSGQDGFTLPDNSRSHRKYSGYSKRSFSAVSPTTTHQSESDSEDDDGLWKKRPVDLATKASENARPSIRNSLFRTSKASSYVSAHRHEIWTRPYPAEVYDNLQEFFPHCDLDKPVMAVDPINSSRAEGIDERKKRVKKSIRMVAEEQSNQVQLGMRRRTTLMWDSKVEELRM
ncbi:MAP kinase kinase kinase mkh1 [Hypsizygus marmoreus]|uniref:MAP kinase kinase kinase mkh1 n=1 Tax=Hypsizygus marmoreus TaxID=39966 RepID=A0A369K3L8_HYPMA|nr:MAP kinase kinase kinase mkh1 [Hypsizygus marmoreus]